MDVVQSPQNLNIKHIKFLKVEEVLRARKQKTGGVNKPPSLFLKTESSILLVGGEHCLSSKAEREEISMKGSITGDTNMIREGTVIQAVDIGMIRPALARLDRCLPAPPVYLIIYIQFPIIVAKGPSCAMSFLHSAIRKQGRKNCCYLDL